MEDDAEMDEINSNEELTEQFDKANDVQMDKPELEEAKEEDYEPPQIVEKV